MSPLQDKFDPVYKSTTPPPTQQIFNIRIDNDNERANAKGRDARDRTRDSRRSSNPNSPTNFPAMPYRKQDKYVPEPMLRSDSIGGSDSGSSFTMDSSSSYSTLGDPIFDQPERTYVKRTYPEAGGHVPFRSRGVPRPRDDGFVQQPFYSGPNDYPTQRPSTREPIYDDHINPPTSWQRPAPPVRRHSVHPNPFTPSPRYAPERGLAYAEPEHAYDYPTQPTQRFLAEREHDPMNLQDIADAVDLLKQTRRSSKVGRRNSVRVPVNLGMAADTDEWAARYDRVHPAYDGFRR
ncbi:hypothetical protein K458DRAFT_420413 [Lentithecium fluviatile CBS 122367]|uniref:Uncharacterized protein n=1 Tax=Lentithecium fluviatile CBS 122367 TaxID=1168545 RepID=A0A6G1ITR6_9PLEO|nr:hypothetical protein K458DRAFT_420413 [Lentithecium fluviatile CBS 122367]